MRTARLAAALLLAVVAHAPAAEPTRLTLTGRGADVVAPTPVVAAIDAALKPGSYRLVPEGDGPALLADVFALDGRTQIGLIVDHLGGQESRTFRIDTAPTSVDRARIVPIDGDSLRISVRGQEFAEYRTDLGNKPILFPLIGPTGKSFTRAYPIEEVEGEDEDHPHQRSFWFTHGNVNGLDFWASDPLNNPNPKFGTIKEIRSARKIDAEGVAVVGARTENEWLGPDGKPVCTDERVFRFYNTEGVRILDLDLTLKASAGPVTFGDTKEGMFGLRLASSMDVKRKQGGRITNAEGIHDNDAWGKASPWVDYTGPVGGQTVGVAILNHPDSFRYPTTWHVRDYGLFAANPFGYHDFGRKESGEHTLPAGESIRFRYRVILHEGNTDSARIAPAFRAYGEPPAVRLD